MKKVFVCLMFLITLSAICVYAQETQIFPAPEVDGKRLDVCLVWGDQCGQPAADAWCKTQGFDSASSWDLAKGIGAQTPTVVLTGRNICDQPTCDGFASITCTRAAKKPKDRLPTLDVPKTIADETPASNESWTTQDVIDPRIDVQAQYSLMRMFQSGGEEAADASAILSAVKSELLAGIYQQDQQKPALRAQKLGKGWWQLFNGQSPDRLAFCWKEPAASPPMIVMRKGVKSTREGLDPALRAAWQECGIPNATPKPYDPTLPPQKPQPSGGGSGSLRVMTVAGDQTPMSDIDVYLYEAGQPVQKDVRKTSSDGYVDFGNLDAGTYDIRVYGPMGSDGRPAYSPVYRQTTLQPNETKLEVVMLVRQGESTPPQPTNLEMKTIEEVFLRYTIIGPPELDEQWKRPKDYSTVEWRRVSVTQRYVPKDATMKRTCNKSGKVTRHYTDARQIMLRMHAEQIVVHYTFDPPPDDPNGKTGNMPPATADEVGKLWDTGEEGTPPC
jgi:hypothetical protein